MTDETAVTEGTFIPDFTVTATGGKAFSLHACRGNHVLLYFYPRDNTPGCTQESQDFRDNFVHFTKEKCLILGVSRDTLLSHEKFKSKFVFPFELLADEEERICELFGVMKMKNMYGKRVRGIERSTFLIDKNSVLRKVWRKVHVNGHVKEALAAVRALNKTEAAPLGVVA